MADKVNTDTRVLRASGQLIALAISSKGNLKKFPNDHYTRNQWNLLQSRQKYGTIPTIVTDRDGESQTFPSRRQARKYRRTCNKPCTLRRA